MSQKWIDDVELSCHKSAVPQRTVVDCQDFAVSIGFSRKLWKHSIVLLFAGRISVVKKYAIAKSS